MKRFKSILCVADTHDSEKAAFDRAASLAHNNQAELSLIIIAEQIPSGIDMPDGGSISRDLQIAIAKQISIDVVVMVIGARTGNPGFIIGNTPEMILHQLDCSVLAIKPAEFVTPIAQGN